MRQIRRKRNRALLGFTVSLMMTAVSVGMLTHEDTLLLRAWFLLSSGSLLLCGVLLAKWQVEYLTELRRVGPLIDNSDPLFPWLPKQ